MNKGKVLGIDYGHVRVGIAVSDVERTIAFGRMTLENKSKKYLIEKINDICSDDNIKEIVIGLPLNMDGSETKQTKHVKKFGNLLKSSLNIPVKYHDERLTSLESDGILNALGYGGREKRKDKDKIAASLILQNYLDLKGKRGQNRG